MKVDNYNNKHILMFTELLEWSNPEQLRIHLTNLYFEYSRVVIKAIRDENSAFSDAEEQLLCLQDIIHVCDRNTEFPQYPQTASEESALNNGDNQINQ